MADENNRIRLSIKPDGTIELDSPPEHFVSAIEKTKDLASALNLGGAKPVANPESVSQAAETPAVQGKLKGKRSKGPGASAARTGRIGSFEEVKGLLTEPQEIALRDFFQVKRPKEQKDEILVAMYKGEEMLGRKGFSYNEIYSLMWYGGIKDLPKALDQVLRDMANDQYVVRNGKGFEVKFVGRNRVENELPAKEASVG